MQKRRTTERVNRLYEKTRALVDGGMTVTAALAKTGMSKASYQIRVNSRKAITKQRGKLAKSTLDVFRLPDDSRKPLSLRLSGSPSEVATFLREIGGGQVTRG